MNIYNQFIEYLEQEEKKFDLNTKNLEKHHILPLYDGGSKDGSIILCSRENHTLAHYYRFLAYDQLGDFVAYKMRRGCKLSSSAISLLGVQKLRRKKLNFFDSNWQSIQGKKPKKNQKPKTKNQIEQYRSVGLSRKKALLTACLKRTMVWKQVENQNVFFKTVEPPFARSKSKGREFKKSYFYFKGRNVAIL